MLLDIDKKEEIKYAWGLGQSTNNAAEYLALYQGLRLAREREIKRLIVIGYSLLVIQQLHKTKIGKEAPRDSIAMPN